MSPGDASAPGWLTEGEANNDLTRTTSHDNAEGDRYLQATAAALQEMNATFENSTPDPIGRTTELPPFPVEALPGVISDMVCAVAEFTQTDPAMAGVVALGVLAALGGGRAEVQVRPGWTEPVNLFTSTVAAPGERKSAVMAVMTGPLAVIERQLTEQVQDKILEATTAKDIANRAAEKAVKAVGSAEDTTDATAEALSAVQAADRIVIPVLPRLTADDVTPEAAASLLAEQGGRLAIMSAEGGIFDIMAGRYSTLPNLDVFLKGHAGDRVRIDRKGRPPEHIERPALTVSLMVQPDVIRSIGESKVFRGRGLLARFLYCLPESRVGFRSVEPSTIPTGVLSDYMEVVTLTGLSLVKLDQPRVLTLHRMASTLLSQFAMDTERSMGPNGNLSHMADWAGKRVGAAARISGLLHLAESDDTEITMAEMSGAIKLVTYFTAHALAAFDFMQSDPMTAGARHILAVIRAKRLEWFTRRDLFHKHIRGELAKGHNGDGPLALLVSSGWLAEAPMARTEGPGRKPSPLYMVHPSVFPPRRAI